MTQELPRVISVLVKGEYKKHLSQPIRAYLSLILVMLVKLTLKYHLLIRQILLHDKGFISLKKKRWSLNLYTHSKHTNLPEYQCHNICSDA